MAPFPFIPSVAGVTVAAAAVVTGAPLFGAGLRALRMRRALSRARAARLAEASEGVTRLQGRVALESPLFAPLSGQRCAGFRLEAHGVDVPVSRSIEEVRPFRLVDGGVVAHVAASRARWDMPQTAERIYAPDEPLTERLLQLLSEMPEAAWLRQSGRRVRLVERALLSGAVCHVIGHAARTRAAVWHEEAVLARTGTDDAPVALTTLLAEAGEAPAWSVTPVDHTEFMHVSHEPVEPADLRVPARNIAGVVAGPLLGLLGLIYLAAAADYWRALRTF